MQIHVNDIFSVIRTSVLGDLAVVRNACRARPTGFQYMPRYRSGVWDGYISLMRGMYEFPTGLLSYVCEVLDEHGILYDVVNNRCKLLWKPVYDDMLKGITLREYQCSALCKLVEAGHGVASMATNSGKTAIMAGLSKMLLDGAGSLTVVHRKELLYQTANRFCDMLNCVVGVVGDGRWSPQLHTIAMVQTLYSRRHDTEKEFSNNVLLMVDECHHVSSDQVLEVLYNIPGMARFGFSGTPLKYDVLSDMRLIGATGPVVINISNRALIDGGWSARPLVVLHTVESDEYWDDDYHTAYSACIVNNLERNAVICDIVVDFVDSVVLILVSRIDHGERLCAMLDGAVFVHGGMDMEYRQFVLDAMRSGKAGVYIASPIFDEGIDVPGVDVVILAGGGKSYIKLLQRVGRGMRKKDGDNVVTIHDFIDDTNKHLLSHSGDRIDIYEKEGFDIQLS